MQSEAEPAMLVADHAASPSFDSAEVVHAATPSRIDAYASPAPHWRSRYQRLVVAIDLLAAIIGVTAGVVIRFGDIPRALTEEHYVLALTVPAAWVVCAGLNRAYEIRFLGAGTIEFERIGRAFLHLVALTAFGAFASKVDLSRGFLLIALPLTFLLSVSGRSVARRQLHVRRRIGSATTPVLAIGDTAEIAKFSDALRVNHHAGLQVAAACLTEDGPVDGATLVERGIAAMGYVDSIREAVVRSGVRSVAVISRHISGEKLRWIAWQLEGTDTDLIMLPGLAEVAGRRLNIQQVGGLPLLYVAEPEFGGMRRVVKAGFDRSVAALALIVVAPLMLAIACAIRLTSSGSVLFLQTRIGKDGKSFRMVKFRSMYSGAERQIVELQAANEVIGGTLFKMRSDPRVTAVGRILRRYSLDEVPQLFNVLAGSMSMVGPRPPLPAEVGSYRGDENRRLLVKPGLTGLWQISGRSDLSWEESVRLDLRYVESWSLTLDLLVLLKTVGAVFRGTGAY